MKKTTTEDEGGKLMKTYDARTILIGLFYDSQKAIELGEDPKNVIGNVKKKIAWLERPREYEEIRW